MAAARHPVDELLPVQRRARIVGHGRWEAGHRWATHRAAAGYLRLQPAQPRAQRGRALLLRSAHRFTGPYDQHAVEQRPDVLVYTTPPLVTETEVTGPVSVALYARSSAPDTGWTAKLVDVHPDGIAVELNNGIQRASFREASTTPTPIQPGKVYRYTITVWPTSNLFRAGHHIRLEISSSDFPQFDSNPNTGSWLGEDTATQVAHQTVLHDAQHPTALLLPVIPAPGSGKSSATFPISTGR
ncbi:MAG TPA: CocE/NonD family hydrolase [Pseudonocardiaceae bacterium]|nr:CocE/NonD family hydrolase [Pseudonocardiaceae bacterium]